MEHGNAIKQVHSDCMTVVSSHRPHGLSEEVARNQQEARKSWAPFFDMVYYFGEKEDTLAMGRTIFIPCADYPTIHQMAEFASSLKGPVAIINADIVLRPPFGEVMMIFKRDRFDAMTSRRLDLESGELLDADRGRDIFILTPKAWETVAGNVPRELRIGHQKWDSWMIGFLRSKMRSFGDFTSARCVFHPKHTSNPMPHGKDIDNAICDVPFPWPPTERKVCP